MKRVLIIGCCGAGKSTLAIGLADKTNLPIIHLDSYYWKPNWIETPKDEWTEIVKRLCSQPEWIMDGNYVNSLPVRLSFADTVIFLDFNTVSCLFGAFRRLILRHRPDKIEGCKERIDFEFLKWIIMFKARQTPKITALLRSYANGKVYVLRNGRQCKEFLCGTLT